MKLGDIFKLSSGKSLPEKKRISGECNVYGGNGITGKHNEYFVEEPTVVIGRVGEYCGAVHLTTEKCWVTDNALMVTEWYQDIDKQFLVYSLNAMDLHQYAKTVGQPSISQANIYCLDIELPSIEEQREIVKILNINKCVIGQRRNELSMLDELIKARFVEMFGDININDKNWDCEPLGELCTIVRGGSPRPIEQFLGGNVPWIKIGDATDGDNIYLNSTKEHIIQEGVKKSRLVKSGSLIFANCGVSLGFARIITFDGCIHDGWLAMEDIDERLDKVFLLQALNQMTEHFRAIAPAGTQPNLNTAIMKVYKQVIPPIELQRDYIKFAEQVEKSKVAVQKALDNTQLLFDSLMQQYFG